VTGRPPARKRFGQHFLEPAWAARVVDAVAPARNQTLVEIGPGRGAMTALLAARAGRLIGVEIDRDLVADLRARLPGVHLIEGDVLQIDLAALLAAETTPVRVVGNLPYNVATPILFQLAAAAGHGAAIADATLMLQREVADRLLAGPGTRDYGVLSVQLGLVAEITRLLGLPPGAFRPPPRVQSAVVRLRFRPPAADVGDPGTFERVVRGIFHQRRKTMLNALRPVAASFGRDPAELLERVQLDGARRPGTLALEEMARLARAVL
jgi:16S rRNA (adenine1518-N6/adenine1519-N6)-dimethyltransferase